MALAIRAVGKLAKAVAKFLGQNELQKLLYKLLEICERIYIGQFDESSKKNFSNFISSFAFIIVELDAEHIDSAVIVSIAQLVDQFFTVFPTLLSYIRAQNYVALTQLFVVLSSKGVVFQQLLSKIVYPGLIKTISPVFHEEDLPLHVPDSERFAFVDYCYLWQNLLGVRSGHVTYKGQNRHTDSQSWYIYIYIYIYIHILIERVNTYISSKTKVCVCTCVFVF